MRALFSEERLQHFGYFSLFIARELRIEDVNDFLRSSSKLFDESLETITPAIGISINPLYSSYLFMSVFKHKRF